MPEDRPELRGWLADALSRRVRHPALEETLFHHLRELEQGPLEQLGQLVHLVIEELRVAQRRVAEQAGELRALQRTVVSLTERLDALAERVAPAPAPAEPALEAAPAVADGHVLLLPGAAGYELVSRNGPPPAPGEQVEHGDRAYRVLGHGPSPLPGDARDCAFLLPARL